MRAYNDNPIFYIIIYYTMYKLTEKTVTDLTYLWYNWTQWFTFFDTSLKWFCIGFWMDKETAIQKWIIYKFDTNPLRKICRNNYYIHHDWIRHHLPKEYYDKFLEWIIGQAQSECWVFNKDVIRFLDISNL
jgi:hypothetical protein